MRKHRALNLMDCMNGRYSKGDLILLCQKITFMREQTCERLIRDMVRVGYLEIDGKGYYKKK